MIACILGLVSGGGWVPAAEEGLSREWSILVPVSDMPPREAISREVTLFVPVSEAGGAAEAVSRELTFFVPVMDSGGGVDAVSREYSLFFPDPRPVPGGLVAWWPGEAEGVDRISGRRAVSVGGAAVGPALIGQGFVLDGVDDAVELPVAARFEAFTVAFWVRPDSAPTSDGVLLSNRRLNGRGWTIRREGGEPASYEFATAFEGGESRARFALEPGTWQLVTVTRNAAHENRVFVDGVLRATATDPGPLVFEGDEVPRLGGGGTGDGLWGGTVDEWMLFDRALGPDDVAALFGAGGSGFDRRLPADLVVTEVAGPASALAGQPVPVAWSVANRGSYSAAGPRRDRLFLRQDGQPDRVLADFEDPTEVPRGSTHDYTATVILPGDLAGFWKLGLTVDFGDVVFEGDREGDNTHVNQVAMAVSVPDLAVESWTVPASPLVAGTPFEVEWTVRNIGSAEARGPWRDAVFLATEPDGDLASARRLHWSEPAGSVAAGAGYPGRATLRLPLAADLPPGDYRLVIAVNAEGGQPEPSFLDNRASRPVSVVRPPLPDLAVARLSAPGLWAGGGAIPVSLTVSNAGAAEASAGWRVGLSLRMGVGSGNSTAPAFLEIAGAVALPPGASWATEVVVPVPLALAAGSGRLVAELDPREELFESDETNNSAAVEGRVPLALFWHIAEAGATGEGTPIEAWLERNGDVSEALEVALTSGDPGELELPARVVIAAHARRTRVVLTPPRDGIVDGSRTVSVLARAAGYPEAVGSVFVRDVDVPVLWLIPASDAVAEGEAIALVVRRSGPTQAPVTVAFGSSAPSQFILPGSVVIPAGAVETTVEVFAADDSLLEANQGYRITASAAGHAPAEASLVIVDNDLPGLSLEIAPGTVFEGAGARAAILTVRRDRASPRALGVRLAHDGPAALRLPESVVIPAFNLAASVPLDALDDAERDGPQTVRVSAVALLTGTGEPVGPVVSRTVTVTDDDGPALGLSLARSVVREGGVVIATLRRNTGSAGELRVALAIDDSREATAPSAVVIPDGRSSVEFAVTSLVDAGPDGSKPVVVTATADGYAGAETTLVVTDADLPDVVPTSVSGPATAWTGDQPLLSFAVANRGVAPFGARITQRLFLSRDPLVGDDLLIGSYDLQPGPGGFPPESAPVGQTIKSAYAFPEAGDYWVIVAADANGAVEEIDEANNVRIGEAPIRVLPEFTATVRVDLADKVRPAGTDIPLVGSITGVAGRPLAGKRVDLHLTVREFHRVISAITDANGAFRTVFRPLPGEAGHYSVGAARAGEPDAAVQDEFTLLGAAFDPARLSASLTEASTETRRVTLRNASEIPLSGLRAEVLGELPEGLAIGAEVGATTLPGLGTVEVVCTLTAGPIEAGPGESGPSPRRFDALVRVTTAEGTTHDLPIEVVVEPLRPRLRVEPAELFAGMVRGGQRVVEFAIHNEGRAESGPLTVALPEAPWLRLVTTNPVPSIAPGARHPVSLLLAPAEVLPFGPYVGALAVHGSGGGLSIPYEFRCLGALEGDLRVKVVDEFTFQVAGSPPVVGARIAVADGFTGAAVTNGISDDRGEFLVTGIPEGYYDVEVTAARHGTTRGHVFVRGGEVASEEAFLRLTTVRLDWSVVPTDVADRYEFAVETQFETDVPVPVITLEPAIVDASSLREGGDTMTIPVTVTNHGLIAGEETEIELPRHRDYRFSAPTLSLGSLAPRSSITVPVTIARIAGNRSAAGDLRDMSAGDGDESEPNPCSVTIRLKTIYFCKGTRRIAKTMHVFFIEGDCVERWSGGIRPSGARAPVIDLGWFVAWDVGPDGIDFLGLEDLCPEQPDFGDPAPRGPDLGAPASSAVPAGGSRSDPPPESGVCARVGLRLEQEAVLTRSAFRATLEIENRDGNALRDVRVDLRFRTLDATDATERFGVRAPVLDGITGVDGSGAIAPQSTGSAEWTLIPALDAAPDGPTTYLVGGTLAYTQDGTRVTVPLADVPITVHPGPELAVDYFHERDVRADDPFTETVEPSIPYALGIMVRNVGRGEARNFRINSGQPRIVDNEKGLLIDFRLIGTEVDGRNLSPSLTADFGNIGAGTNAIGRWLFTSTLQGLFVDYRASFEHLDAIAGRRLSIVTNVAIHEMIRTVRAPGEADDGRVDFLLDEEPDLEDLPDTVWLSDGTRQPVETVGAVRVSGLVPSDGGEVVVTFAAPGGFSYARFPDPAGAVGELAVRLVDVRRPGGSSLPRENFWQTDRTFVGRGRPPVRENVVHVFDRGAAGSYTLIYEALAPRDTVPPTSRVGELAASVPPAFPVQWDGSDAGAGPLWYDIWVSENGEPFVPWLRDVEGGSRLFEGRAGSAYAFYSVARDAAGNREAPPATPDARTVAGRGNRAPVIAPLADRDLVEGGVLVVPVVVNDPDGDRWTLRVVEGPVGLALETPGVLRWATGPATGPGPRRITVEARDSGVPSAVARATFLVTVQDFDAPPVAAQDVLERLPGKRLRVAESFLLANDADPDGRPLTLVAVSTGGLNGGQVRRAEGWITYVPPPGSDAPDQFTYTVSDGAREATGVVLVLVGGVDDAATLNLVGARALEGGGIRLTVAGIPGRRYAVQVATSVVDPVWVSVGEATADAVGRFDFEDPAPPPVMAFYRAVEAAATGEGQADAASGTGSEPSSPSERGLR